ncbi:MAG: hypothetical protein WD851_12305 [Pirellulales bacterium]
MAAIEIETAQLSTSDITIQLALQAQADKLGESALLLAAKVSEDLQSSDEVVAAAAAALRDQFATATSSYYTLFAGLGIDRELDRKTDSSGFTETVLGFTESGTYTASDRLLIDLRGHQSIVQVTTRNGGASVGYVSSALTLEGDPEVEDAHVDPGNGGTNYGSSTSLATSYDVTFGEGTDAFIRFLLPSTEVGKMPTKATLTLTKSSGGTGEGAIQAIQDFFGR